MLSTTTQEIKEDTIKPEIIERPVLLLNSSYEPIHLITVRRAIILVLAEKAEIVESEKNAFLRSVTIQIESPVVVRLKTYIKIPYRNTITLTRRALMERDHHSCQYCGKVATTIDHIIPRSLGGGHTWENTAACCKSCNAKKGAKTLEELGWKLLKQPIAPKGGVHWLLIGKLEKYPQWENYI
jgi:5-methylcytosine-specific restriction endonuclease McrA